MSRWNGVRRSAIPMGALFLLFGLWALHSSQKEDSGRADRIVPETACERQPALPLRPDPTPVGAVPQGAEVSSRAASPDGMEVRKIVEDALTDCRRALALHERTLGERAYRTLVRYRTLALACAREGLKQAKHPSDRDSAERAVALLSLPPTHGLLKHFQW